MSASFTQAAASYFGLTPQVTEIGTSLDGQMLAVFTIALTNEDIAAIVARMQQMEQAEQAVPTFTPDEPVDTAALRATYDAMTPQEKGKYGSFARFLRNRDLVDYMTRQASVTNDRGLATGNGVGVAPEGTIIRTVTHVDGPEPTDDGAMPEAVWVSLEGMTQQQMSMVSDFNPSTDEYLIQTCMLTPEQRQKYGVKP